MHYQTQKIYFRLPNQALIGPTNHTLVNKQKKKPQIIKNMCKISTFKTIALLLANKNIKTQSKNNFLNTFRPKLNLETKKMH